MKRPNMRLFGSKLDHKSNEHKNFLFNMRLLQTPKKSHILACDCETSKTIFKMQLSKNPMTTGESSLCSGLIGHLAARFDRGDKGSS